jgi:S-adenosylmethionine uptake transporter
MCLAKLLFSIQDVIIKEMSSGYAVHQIMVLRGLVATPLVFVLIVFRGGLTLLQSNQIPLLLLRGALMFASFSAFYLALSSIPLTVATVLFFSAPFFVTLLSIPILGESVDSRRWLGIVVGFCGVVIVIRPAASDLQLSMLLPILAALMYATAQILTRPAGVANNAMVITFYANICFTALGIVLAVVMSFIPVGENDTIIEQFLYRQWVLPEGGDIWLLLGTGITSALGFLFSTQAYRTSEVSMVAPFEYVMLVWITIISYLVWDELPDGVTILGAVIIVVASLYILRGNKKSNTRRG